MPQSFTRLYAHLVFSTKGRRPFLDEARRADVHAYLAGAIRGMGSARVVVGGVADHVHVLLEMAKLRTPVELVQEIKRQSSKHLKTFGPLYRDFSWQRGYAMFSVSPPHVGAVERYIANQERHHRKRTFEDELRAFLDRYGIPFDERYIWD